VYQIDRQNEAPAISTFALLIDIAPHNRRVRLVTDSEILFLAKALRASVAELFPAHSTMPEIAGVRAGNILIVCSD
jgi:hypothetical protein